MRPPITRLAPSTKTHRRTVAPSGDSTVDECVGATIVQPLEGRIVHSAAVPTHLVDPATLDETIELTAHYLGCW